MIWRTPHPDTGRLTCPATMLIWRLIATRPDGTRTDRYIYTRRPLAEIVAADALADGLRITSITPEGWATDAPIPTPETTMLALPTVEAALSLTPAARDTLLRDLVLRLHVERGDLSGIPNGWTVNTEGEPPKFNRHIRVGRWAMVARDITPLDTTDRWCFHGAADGPYLRRAGFEFALDAMIAANQWLAENP